MPLPNSLLPLPNSLLPLPNRPRQGQSCIPPCSVNWWFGRQTHFFVCVNYRRLLIRNCYAPFRTQDTNERNCCINPDENFWEWCYNHLKQNVFSDFENIIYNQYYIEIFKNLKFMKIIDNLYIKCLRERILKNWKEIQFLLLQESFTKNFIKIDKVVFSINVLGLK